MDSRAIQNSLAAIRRLTQFIPEVGVVMGTGLGGAVGLDRVEASIPYKEIPGFPEPRVVGHPGRLQLGELFGVRVAILAGRAHYYEGYGLPEITLPIRVLKGLGAHSLILTNAAGGLDPAYEAGDLVLIADHLNLMGGNPLRGLEDPDLGERFVELSDPYDPNLRRIALEVAQAEGVVLREGVYAGLAGPSLETRAECRALRILGADLVGMSTVPEVIVARQVGLKVLGISVVTNRAGVPAGADVIRARAEGAAPRLGRLIQGILCRLREEGELEG